MNKGPYLANAVQRTYTTVKVAGDQDIEHPVLTIDGATDSLINYTYCYIAEWNRYYFIVSRRWMSGNIYQVFLSEDYIYSAKSVIEVQTGYCKYSGLGDQNLPDSRIIFNPEVTINRFDIERISANYHNNLYCMRFYTATPFVTGEGPQNPSDWNGGNINQAAVFLSQASLTAFCYYYLQLSETQRIAVGKAIASISFIPFGCYVNSNAFDVTKLNFQTGFSGSGIEIGVTSNYPAQDFARVVYSPEVVYTAMDPIEFRVVSGNPSAPHRFNRYSRFWELHALYTLKHPGLQPINIEPAKYGKRADFNITYSVNYEPFSDQYIISLFPDVQDGKYTPIIQKNMLSVPFMIDNSLQQEGFATIATALNMAGGITGGIAGMTSGNALNAISSGAGILSGLVNAAANAERLELADQIGYSVTGSPSIALYYSRLINGQAKLYQAYKTPISTPWGYMGIPDGHWRTIVSLQGTGYAEIDLVDIDDNALFLTANEIEEVKTRMLDGVIFNASP